MNKADELVPPRLATSWLRGNRRTSAYGSPRFAIVSTPRSGNTWLRRLLAAFFALQELPVHTPTEVDWSQLPERCVVQLHWPRVGMFTELLAEHDLQVCVLIRHPLDTLISILHLAAHNPDTARWLDGAHGTEQAIINAEPCSRAFSDYAISKRARGLISVSPQWWNRDATARIRFEQLIRQPAVELERIAVNSGVAAAIPASEAVRSLPFLRMQREVGPHFWQGEPGLWRRLLPSAYASVIAAPYRRHAQRYGYDLTPDPALTIEAAREEWRARSLPPPRPPEGTP